MAYPPFYSSSTPPYYSTFTTVLLPSPNLSVGHGCTPPFYSSSTPPFYPTFTNIPPQSPNPYTSYVSSSNPYTYGSSVSAGSLGYYNSIHPYSQPIGYQNSSSSYAPQNPFSNSLTPMASQPNQELLVAMQELIREIRDSLLALRDTIREEERLSDSASANSAFIVSIPTNQIQATSLSEGVVARFAMVEPVVIRGTLPTPTVHLARLGIATSTSHGQQKSINTTAGASTPPLPQPPNTNPLPSPPPPPPPKPTDPSLSTMPLLPFSQPVSPFTKESSTATKILLTHILAMDPLSETTDRVSTPPPAPPPPPKPPDRTLSTMPPPLCDFITVTDTTAQHSVTPNEDSLRVPRNHHQPTEYHKSLCSFDLQRSLTGPAGPSVSHSSPQVSLPPSDSHQPPTIKSDPFNNTNGNQLSPTNPVLLECARFSSLRPITARVAVSRVPSQARSTSVSHAFSHVSSAFLHASSNRLDLQRLSVSKSQPHNQLPTPNFRSPPSTNSTIHVLPASTNQSAARFPPFVQIFLLHLICWQTRWINRIGEATQWALLQTLALLLVGPRQCIQF